MDSAGKPVEKENKDPQPSQGSARASTLMTTQSSITMSEPFSRDTMLGNLDGVFRVQTRHLLFKGVKFISNPAMLDFGGQISQLMLSACNVKGDVQFQQYVWETHKGTVEETINRRRNDVAGEIKKGFYGRLLCAIVCCWVSTNCCGTLVFGCSLDG